MIKRNDKCWCGSGKKYKNCHFLCDKEKKGNNKMKSGYCKSPQEIAGMRKAGEFNGKLMDYIRDYVRPGISTQKIDGLVYDYTVSNGHKPAPLNYLGFPKSVCVSVNNVVCHGIPSDKVILKEGDIVNIDLTSIVDGFHGDSSETFLIGDVSEDARRLVKASAEALLKGIDAVKPGLPLSEIGETIEPFINSKGFSVVRQYTGHGVGRKFHENFTVYHHVSHEERKIILEPGMTFTIEPMINAGSYKVLTDKEDGWTVYTKDGSLSAQFEHTVAVTEENCEVLTLTPSQKKSGKILLMEL